MRLQETRRQLVNTVGGVALMGLAAFPAVSCGNEETTPATNSSSRAVLSEIKPSPTVIFEKAPEPGWTRITSPKLPYQLDYPPSWRALGEDFYEISTANRRARLQILSEKQGNEKATSEDYRNIHHGEITTAYGSTTGVMMEELSFKGENAWKLTASITSITPNFKMIDIIVVNNGRVWKIRLQGLGDNPTSEREFNKILESFKFLQ